ncbi:MAG: preprotein translocase subunit SecA [Candidatus Nanopelagicales bacterium]
MVLVLDKLLRAGEGKILKKLENYAKQINLLEPEFKNLTDEQLKNLTASYKQRVKNGESLDDLLPEAFATVREAAIRTIGQRHYDVQLMGGAALHLGNIAEMKTGEGKTLVSTLPVYLNALSDKGVHVVTVNDYLAHRDAEWMGRIHRFLGLTVGTISPNMDMTERKNAYLCDITYGTNNEFGFDYLRDNMAWSPNDRVQRGYNFAVVDEVDSILIDEARTPLIISGPADGTSTHYKDFARIANSLQPSTDYEVDIKKRTVGVLEVGIEKVEKMLNIDNLYESVNTPLIGFLNNALKAKELFKKDKDYVIMNGEVLIVDEHTGRILQGRRYNEGMHQAIEAKENVEIKQENQTLATITLQNYFRMYRRLSGMTGTAMTEAAEFDKIYKLGVVPIPTNKKMIRLDNSDLIYRTEEAKFNAVVEDIATRYEKGQPILIGTTSVERSEYLSGLLKRRGIPHEVLNAKNHAREASIVAQAGRKGAVTVATNMAGRGTDIMLGGNPEFLANAALIQKGLDPEENLEQYNHAYLEELKNTTLQVANEHDEVANLGGLYVLGTERHESRRIDNQLRGRSGRQGDPGESRFYLSLQDELMRRFKGELVDAFLRRFNVPDDVPIEAKMVTNAIRNAQTQVEQQNFEIRKNVLKYDEVLNKQRQVIYEERRQVLEGEDLSPQIKEFIEETIRAYVLAATSEGYPEQWDLDQLLNALRNLYPVAVSIEALKQQNGGSIDQEILLEAFLKDVNQAYETREALLTSKVMRELERQVVLSVLDRKWREHLYEMDYLQEGIGLRAMGQRDPLVEYQKEGYDLFVAMMDAIKEQVVGFVFNAQVQVQENQQDIEAKGFTKVEKQNLSYSAPTLDNSENVKTVTQTKVSEVGRNEPCPCGSGKKYKRCHGASGN